MAVSDGETWDSEDTGIRKQTTGYQRGQIDYLALYSLLLRLSMEVPL